MQMRKGIKFRDLEESVTFHYSVIAIAWFSMNLIRLGRWREIGVLDACMVYDRKRKWSEWESGGSSAFPPSPHCPLPQNGSLLVRSFVRSFVRRCGCAIASGTRNGTGVPRLGRPVSPCAHWLINIVAELDSSEMGILIGNQCRPATTKPVRPSGKRFANANTVAPGSPHCRFFFRKNTVAGVLPTCLTSTSTTFAVSSSSLSRDWFCADVMLPKIARY